MKRQVTLTSIVAAVVALVVVFAAALSVILAQTPEERFAYANGEEFSKAQELFAQTLGPALNEHEIVLVFVVYDKEGVCVYTAYDGSGAEKDRCLPTITTPRVEIQVWATVGSSDEMVLELLSYSAVFDPAQTAVFNAAQVVGNLSGFSDNGGISFLRHYEEAEITHLYIRMEPAPQATLSPSLPTEIPAGDEPVGEWPENIAYHGKFGSCILMNGKAYFSGFEDGLDYTISVYKDEEGVYPLEVAGVWGYSSVCLDVYSSKVVSYSWYNSNDYLRISVLAEEDTQVSEVESWVLNLATEGSATIERAESLRGRQMPTIAFIKLDYCAGAKEEFSDVFKVRVGAYTADVFRCVYPYEFYEPGG